MRKEGFALLAAGVIVLGGLFWVNRCGYEIDDRVSDAEQDPLDGIHFALKADRRDGELRIQNDSERYIVLDFGRKPLAVEIRQEDGWHRIQSTRLWRAEPGAIPEHTAYSLDFSWRDVIDGPLKPGAYRAILFYGDGKVDAYAFFSTITEFTVD